MTAVPARTAGAAPTPAVAPHTTPVQDQTSAEQDRAASAQKAPPVATPGEGTIRAWFTQSGVLSWRQLSVMVHDKATFLQLVLVPILTLLMFKVVLGDAIGSATGPILIAAVSDHVFGGPEFIGRGMAVVIAVCCPIGAAILAFGCKHMREVMPQTGH